MSSKNLQDKTTADFNKLAKKIGKDLPEIWTKTKELYGGNIALSVEFLTKNQPALGKSVVELAQDGPEGLEEAIKFITKVDYGVYI